PDRPGFPRLTTVKLRPPRARKIPAGAAWRKSASWPRHPPSWAEQSQGHPEFRCLQGQLDPTIETMSRPSLVFRRSGECRARRGDRAWGRRGYGVPAGETVRGADAYGGDPVPAAGVGVTDN